MDRLIDHGNGIYHVPVRTVGQLLDDALAAQRRKAYRCQGCMDPSLDRVCVVVIEYIHRRGNFTRLCFLHHQCYIVREGPESMRIKFSNHPYYKAE